MKNALLLMHYAATELAREPHADGTMGNITAASPLPGQFANAFVLRGPSLFVALDPVPDDAIRIRFIVSKRKGI